MVRFISGAVSKTPWSVFSVMVRGFLSVRPPSHRAPTFATFVAKAPDALDARGTCGVPRSIARGAELTRTLWAVQAV